ncbi:MAG: hypothetical protein WD022_11775 [Balneolaceae bacterium]
MASRVIFLKIIGILLILIISGEVYAQNNIQHTAPLAVERGQANVLEFSIPGLTRSDVRQARLFYRYDGDFGYTQQEVELQNTGTFRVQFYVDNNNASSLEYYFEVTLASGEGVYYPSNLPSENPVEVGIVEDLEKDEKQKLDNVDYTILSPTPGNGVTRDNVVIAIALFYDIADLEPGEFKLYLDQRDITSLADTSAYYISYIPKGLRPGQHNISLEYEASEETFSVTEWNFIVVSPGQASFQGFAQRNIPQGQFELTGRNQVIAGDINNAYSGRTRINGKYGLLRYALSGYLTSQEDQRLQPQNRYSANLSLGKWWNFEAGHVYPSMSQFTISGRRVHGINTSLHLLNENINFQFIYGELDHNITNQYDSLLVKNVVNSADSVIDQNYLLTFEDGGRGTFRRKVIGGRFSLGKEEKFELGFNALKIQDDTSSIYNVRNYQDIFNSNLDLNNNLSPVNRDSLIANPDLLDISGGSVKPRDNIVIGSDLKFGFHNNRIRFRSEGVISALNNNIYGGPLNSQRLDDLGFDVDQEVLDLLESISWLIIVNENMSTLPLQISENDEGEIDAEPFFPTSILAGNSEVSLRYPNNNFRLQYRWIGPNFSSLANSTIRKDIAGFTLSDRINMLSNRLYLTLGYENLKDNVTGSRDATTQTLTYRTNVSWYPVDRSLPRVTTGLRYRTRDNGIERENYLVAQISEDLVNAAVQNVREQLNAQDSLVALVTPTPRRNYSVNFNTSISQQFNALNARNDVSLSYSNLKTTDEVFAFGDVVSSAFSLNFTSRFNDAPYETQFGFTYNNTESGSGLSEIIIKGFHAGGDIRLLDNKLSVNARLAFTQNESLSRTLNVVDNPNSDELNDNPRDNYYVLSDDPADITENNFKTYVFQTGARYNIDDHHSLIFDANMTNVGGANTANDRIVQLRYVYRF